MHHTTTTTNTLVGHLADFVLGALPILAALGGIAALFLGPLWILARSLNVA